MEEASSPAKKGPKETTKSNKFLIEYRMSHAKNKQEREQEYADRKVLYQCENVETATYIVHKIKAQMRLF